MITLIVPGPNGKSVRIIADNPTSKTIISMILRRYRDNGCRF